MPGESYAARICVYRKRFEPNTDGRRGLFLVPTRLFYIPGWAYARPILWSSYPVTGNLRGVDRSDPVRVPCRIVGVRFTRVFAVPGCFRRLSIRRQWYGCITPKTQIYRTQPYNISDVRLRSLSTTLVAYVVDTHTSDDVPLATVRILCNYIDVIIFAFNLQSDEMLCEFRMLSSPNYKIGEY